MDALAKEDALDAPPESMPTQPPGAAAEVRPAKSAGPSTPTARPRSARRAFLVLFTVVGIVVVSVASYAYLTRNLMSTDDAQIDADIVTVAPQVGGRIAKVEVRSDEHVHAGDVIAVIDERDLEAQHSQALAELASAKAAVAAAEAQEEITAATASGGLETARAAVVGSQVTLSGADSQIAIAEAELARARADAQRTALVKARDKTLFDSGTIAEQQWDDARLADEAAQAAVTRAKSALSAARSQKRGVATAVAAAQGQLAQSTPVAARIAAAHAATALAQARAKQAQAAVELAELKLGYATVTAPNDGTVSAVGVTVGELVVAGQPIAQLVPDTSYVVANFKETQVGEMRVGDHATIAIDAYPGRKFPGVVRSLSAGTGARFSALPPSNATGNFVKVVQRVPVHIDWLSPPDVVARAGMSVVATVDVGTHDTGAAPAP